MRFNTVVSSAIGLGVSAVQAAPAATGFSSSCSDLTINNNWLVGKCPSDSNETVESSVFLGYRITNNDATLAWQSSGSGNYFASCSSCSLVAGSGVMSCTCTHSSSSSTQTTTINLEDHIVSVDGTLRFSFDQTPTVPADNGVAVPSDFTLSADLSVSTAGQCASGFGWKEIKPEDCFTVTVTSAGPMAFTSTKVSVNPGYEISYFSSKDCSGTAIGKVEVSDTGSCKVFEQEATSFTVTPLWKADW